MTLRHRVSPWLLLISSSLLLLLIVAAIAWPTSKGRLVLLGIGLCAGVVLLVAYLFAQAAHLFALADELQVVKASLKSNRERQSEEQAELRSRLDAHIAHCPATDDAIVRLATYRGL